MNSQVESLLERTISEAVEAHSAAVEEVLARVFADVGDECRSIRIGDTVWTTHQLEPATERERYRLRALGCSCAQQVESWSDG